MNRLIRGAAAFSLVLSLAAPMAMAEEAVDAATVEKVTAQLTAEGYEVRKVGREDGYIEVYAVKDGKTYELYLDETLKVVKSNDD